MDEYEKEFVGENLLDYDERLWYKHDFQNRLCDLSKLIFGIEPEPEIVYRGEPGFTSLVPMVLAGLVGLVLMAIGIIEYENPKDG